MHTLIRLAALAVALAPALLTPLSQSADAAPRVRHLYPGFNYLGPSASISPAEFVSCLGDSWSAIWYYSASESRWRWHFPEGNGPGQVPAHINSPLGNGIGTIPGGRGVAVYITDEITEATIPTRPGEGCVTTN